MISVDERQVSTLILEPYTATILAEISDIADGGDINIDVDKTNIDALLASDQKPMFVTLPVARDGTSANGRIYAAKNIESIAEQINSDHRAPRSLWTGPEPDVAAGN
jgi:hypothetical protein